MKGVDLDNVFLLRDSADQEEIKKRAANAKKVVVLGSSFIGSESASSLKMKYKDDL